MTTLELIRQAVEKLTDIDPALVVPEASLETLELDSLTMVEILFTIEDVVGKRSRQTRPRPSRPHPLIERAADLRSKLSTLRPSVSSPDSLKFV